MAEPTCQELLAVARRERERWIDLFARHALEHGPDERAKGLYRSGLAVQRMRNRYQRQSAI